MLGFLPRRGTARGKTPNYDRASPLTATSAGSQPALASPGFQLAPQQAPLAKADGATKSRTRAVEGGDEWISFQACPFF